MKKAIFPIAAILCSAFTANMTFASTLFFLPQQGEYKDQETFIESLEMDTEGNEINAVESKIEFNAEILEVIDVIKGDSIVKFWAKEPVELSTEGTIAFAGGIPNGYKGRGAIMKIIFKAKKPGNCGLNLSETKVLLNDGKATQDKSTFLNSGCSITEKSPAESKFEITSRTHPDPSRWYANKNFNLHWDLTEGAEYSYILSKDYMAEPDETANKPEGNLIWMGDMSYKGLEDGIYYFHIKRKLPGGNWSGKATLRAMIDAAQPEDFKPQIAEIEGKKYLVFAANDAMSGVDYYEVLELDSSQGSESAEENFGWKRVSSPYLLKNQSANIVIKVKAVDKAGNEKMAEFIPSLPAKAKSFPNQVVLLALGAMAVASIGLIILRIVIRKKR